MPIDSRHKTYKGFRPLWDRCRAAIGGSDEIKDGGTKYLPRLSAQSYTEYEAYKDRALYYNASGRTVQGIGGAAFRRPPRIIDGDNYPELWDDVTLDTVPFDVFSRSVWDEILTTGRVGVYVDMPDETDADMPARPYAVYCTAENIVNWRMVYSRAHGKNILSRIVIFEIVDDFSEDEYEPKEIEQYRELALIDGAYTVRVWRESKNDNEKWEIVSTVVPVRLGQPLDFIPFQFIGVSDLTPDVEKPPLLDLVDVNISHYKSSADLEHGRHYTGLPTPYVAGFPRDVELRIGANVAWVSDDPSAKAGILEFTGQGLGALERALETKEHLMAVLGARLLEQQKRAAETADAVRLRQAGEAGAVQGMINALEAGMQNVVDWLVWWSGGDAGTVQVEYNRDVIDISASPEEINAYTQMLQSGAISYETFYYLLERAEMTRPDVDAEEEQAAIGDNASGGTVARRGEPPTPEEQAAIDARVEAVGA